MMISINRKEKIKNAYAFFFFFSSLFLWDLNIYNVNFKTIIYPTLIISFFLNLKKIDLKSVLICGGICLSLLIHYFLTTSNGLISLKDISEIILIFFLFFFCKTHLDFLIKNIENIIYIFFFIFSLSILFSLIESNFYLSGGMLLDINHLCSFTFNFLNEKSIFKEKSHLGMISVGCYLLFLDKFINEKSIYKKILIIIFLFLLFINASTTFFVGIVSSVTLILIFNFRYFKRLIPSILLCFFIITILVNASTCKVRFVQIPKILDVYNLQSKNTNSKTVDQTNNKTVDQPNNKTVNQFDSRRVEFNKLYNKRFKLIEMLLSDKIIDKTQIIIQLSKVENDLINLNENLYMQLSKNLSTNLTSQVHIRSLNVAKKSITDRPLGFGYNNYYFANNYYKYDLISPNPFADQLNHRDGTNLSVKLIVEYGLISIIFFFVCFLFLISNKIDFELKLFLIPFLITQGVRGAGYWNGGFLMIFMIMLLVLIKSYQLKKIR